jgi:hypothetical protein
MLQFALERFAMESVAFLEGHNLHRLPCLGYAFATAPQGWNSRQDRQFAESLEARAVCMANDNLGK